MEIQTRSEIESFIQKTLTLVSPKLDKETIDHVTHYIDHGEYEMAFEGLFLEIMELKDTVQIDHEESKKIAILLKLDNETVFDFGFWNKFKNFVAKK